MPLHIPSFCSIHTLTLDDGHSEARQRVIALFMKETIIGLCRGGPEWSVLFSPLAIQGLLGLLTRIGPSDPSKSKPHQHRLA